MHFSLKIHHLLATVLMIFLRVLPKSFSVAPLVGGPMQELGVPGSLNRLNPGSYATDTELTSKAEQSEE